MLCFRNRGFAEFRRLISDFREVLIGREGGKDSVPAQEKNNRHSDLSFRSSLNSSCSLDLSFLLEFELEPSLILNWV